MDYLALAVWMGGMVLTAYLLVKAILNVTRRPPTDSTFERTV